MGSHLCLSIGAGCSRSIPPAATSISPPDDVLRFPIWIGQTVQWGSANVVDVKIVQQALNLIPANEGGPSPKLKPDGIYGPLTNAAIIKFQNKYLGFADGKVEPGKATINKLNELEPVWLTVPPEIIDRIYSATMPVVVQCAKAADTIMETARSAVLAGRVPAPNDIDFESFALLNKHFAIEQNPNKDHDFELIAGIFHAMVDQAAGNLLASAAQPADIIALPGRFTFSWAYSSTMVAQTRSNGVNLAGKTQTVKAEDGSPLVLSDDKIMILYPYIRSSADAEICTILHEMAHFLGPPDDSVDSINDQRGGYGTPDQISHLSPPQRARNAENYSNFAFEAFFGREPVNMII